MKIKFILPAIALAGWKGEPEEDDDEGLGTSKIMESWAETKCGACKETLRPLRIQLHVLSQPEKDGNKWDVKKRGPWATSETRLIRVLEELCRFGGKADATCAALVEKNEEAIEEWFYAGADPATWIDEICVKAAGHCCSSADQQGPNCEECPKGQNGLVCSGNGKCDGGGDREIIGKCKCNRIDDQAYYEGETCSECPSDDSSLRTFSYFLSNAEKLESETPMCLRCDKACKGGCSAKGPENCTECKEGYAWQIVGGQGGMNVSSDGVLQGAKRACVSLSKPKTILEKKAAATGTQKIFDPDLDIKEAQEIIKRQYKEKEERRRQAEAGKIDANINQKDEL